MGSLPSSFPHAPQNQCWHPVLIRDLQATPEKSDPSCTRGVAFCAEWGENNFCRCRCCCCSASYYSSPERPPIAGHVCLMGCQQELQQQGLPSHYNIINNTNNHDSSSNNDINDNNNNSSNNITTTLTTLSFGGGRGVRVRQFFRSDRSP